MTESRIICFDYGRRRIGIAVSDPLRMTAQPLETWEGAGTAEIMGRIKQLFQEYSFSRVVVGLPLNMNGSKGPMAKEAEIFASRLRDAVHVPVVLWDERLSSIQARNTLHALNVKAGRKKGRVDRLAASIVLQSYLDAAEHTAGWPEEGRE